MAMGRFFKEGFMIDLDLLLPYDAESGSFTSTESIPTWRD